MKKLNLMILFILLITLMACSKKDEEGVPNGMLPLEAITGCNEPTLDDGQWVCIWADEFEGDEIDLTKWSFQTGGDGWGNNEVQYYREENASIVDGKLVITAKNESFGGRQYTSARLTTRYRGDFRYARVIVRAKMPSGVGTWPAIWMMPTMNAYGTWPNSGEIDIMEHVGYQPNVIHTTIHTAKFNHNDNTQLGYSKTIQNAETEFHDYEIIWSPGSIESFVNGERYGQFAYSAAFNQEIDYHRAFPFDQLFYIILNVAVGGNWGGREGVDPEAFPTSMEVDYVRVYQLDYATLDKDVPTTPENLRIAQNLANSIFWAPSSDDTGVEKYAVYINGELIEYTNLNQYRLRNLERGQSYQVQIQAIDFVGRKSTLSDTLLVNFQ
jgi:beta-glucanase (GH16 family)